MISIRTGCTLEMIIWDMSTTSKCLVSSSMHSTTLKTRLLCKTISVISSTTRIIQLSSKWFTDKCIKIKNNLQIKLGTKNNSITPILYPLNILKTISNTSKEICVIIINSIKTLNIKTYINSKILRGITMINWINKIISMKITKDTNKIM